MLHSNCSAEALPHTPLLFLTIKWLLCVCILSDRACTHLGGGRVRCTIVQDAFEWHPMSALWNTSVHLNFYLGDGFACSPAFQIEFVWKICNIFSISFGIFAFFFFPIYSPVWFGQIRHEASSFSPPPLTHFCVASFPQHCQDLAPRSVTAGWSCICLWIAAGRGDFILAHRAGGLLCALDELLTASYEPQLRHCTWTSFLSQIPCVK